MWLEARSGYLPPCGGGRLARAGREPGGGCRVRRVKQVPPSPSLPHKGGGSRSWPARSQGTSSQGSRLTHIMNEMTDTIPSRSAPAAPEPALEGAIARATKALVELQRSDGHWVFELEADATIPAEYVLLQHYLGEGDAL